MSHIFTFFAFLMVSAYGDGVDSAHIQCDLDHQCLIGYFCYEESHYCTRCLECGSYKRKPSWRSCPKTPSDCGSCVTNYEEEILHEGKTRDMCILSTPNTLSHTTVSNSNVERYLWVGAAAVILLPFMFYAFCRKNRLRDRGVMHHGLPHEEPPPYRSIELTTLTSNNSEEQLAEEDHVLTVGQQKDSLVQAVPFRQPDYPEQLLAFDNNQDPSSDVESIPEDIVVAASPNVELHDDNTMPSDWTPAETDGNGQLMTFECTEVETVSDPEDTCEPASKRHKANSSPDNSDSYNSQQININLFINNNVTIHKPT
uniref:TNFR-Cys domain-containing protein n=1 Tax=Graphocephala atropunctata TaxID=36148 RepID=A0A1B6MGD6_9HEMI